MASSHARSRPTQAARRRSRAITTRRRSEHLAPARTRLHLRRPLHNGAREVEHQLSVVRLPGPLQAAVLPTRPSTRHGNRHVPPGLVDLAFSDRRCHDGKVIARLVALATWRTTWRRRGVRIGRPRALMRAMVWIKNRRVIEPHADRRVAPARPDASHLIELQQPADGSLRHLRLATEPTGVADGCSVTELE